MKNGMFVFRPATAITHAPGVTDPTPDFGQRPGAAW